MGEDAASGVFAFLFAGVLFLAVVGGVLFSVRDIGRDDGESQGAQQKVSAQGIADVLAGNVGQWGATADDLQRLGLLNQNGSGFDLATMALMRGGTFDASTNGLVDYDEVRSALGLSSSQDLHLRLYPPNFAAYLATADLSHVRTAYIGDWLTIPSETYLPLGPVVVQQMAQATMDSAANILASSERDAIDAIGVDFNDHVYLDYSGWDLEVESILPPDDPLNDYLDLGLLEGGVYPDDKSFLDAVLPARLNGYDLLIVGSQVDQSSLTSNVVKSAIEDWVLAGGTLMVLGSDAQNFQWLQPIFSVGVATVNGGASTPDVSHPMLLQPNELSWTDYDNFGLGWDLKDQGNDASYDDFQHIIQEDGEDVLAVSLPGAFGDGRIYLTTYRVGDIADTLGLSEASGFVHNMVLYDDRDDLFLDYGPEVPQGTTVASASRTSFVWDDDLGQVPMRLEVLYWEA